MLVLYEDESNVKRKLLHEYGKIVQVPKVEGCYLNNNMIKEKDCAKIDYDKEQMVDAFTELYKRGAIKKVSI